MSGYRREVSSLTAFIGHGSDLDVPIRELPRMFADLKAPTGVTDAILVTDALCQIPAPVRESFLAWKRAARGESPTACRTGARWYGIARWRGEMLTGNRRIRR